MLASEPPARNCAVHLTFGFKPGMTPRRRGLFRLLRQRGPHGLNADDVKRALEPVGFELLEAHDAGIDANGISRTGWYLSRKR